MEGAAGFSHFPGNLDPRAQEFIPRNFFSSFPLLSPTLYYPYPPPLPAFNPQTPVYFNSDNYQHQPPSMTVPSRALIISMLPGDISESVIRKDLEVFGDVRAVQMGRIRDGIVTVNFYDIRQARRALVVIQEQNMQQQYRLRKYYDELNIASASAQNSVPFGGLNLVSFIPPPPVPPPAPGLIAGKPVWAHFTVPVAYTMPDGSNQGTLVIFNLDPAFPSYQLKRIFEPYGHVKELRETPMKKGHRFVEFYDVRDAAVALSEMNGKEINGKKILIEYSRPGGQCKKLSKAFRNASRNNRYSHHHPVSATAGADTRPLRIMPRSPPTPPLPPPRMVRLADKGILRGPSSSSSSANGIEELGFSTCSIQLKCKGFKSSSPSSSKSRLQRPRCFIAATTRPLKGQSKELDSNFLINEEAIMESNCRDSRTTVMIKNIPNKYSLKIFLNMLDDHCIRSNEQIGDDGNTPQPPLSSYDFVYLPIDFINKCNVGYGFVNMTSPEATWRLYKAFHHQNWEIFNSRKICEVTYARLQGIEALKEHFKNSKFSCEVDEYMPMTFLPPRDGRLQTEPVPIVCRHTTPSPGASSKGKSDDWEEGYIGDFQEHEEFGEKINAGGYEADGYDDEELNSGGGGGSSSSNGGGESGGEYYYEGVCIDDDVTML